MKVFSIVVTYNGEAWIDKCFGSLLNSTIDDHIIIAVDNGSKDNTVSLIKKKYPLVEIIEANENLGFAKANNIGLKRAEESGADFIFLLNQDAWIERETLKKLINISLNNPNYGILAPIRKYANNKLELHVLRNIVDKGAEGLINDLYDSKKLNYIYNIDFIGAAAWLLTKETIRRVGGFDTIFFHYGEDNDYCRRVLLSGLDIGICPRYIAVHDTEERTINHIMSKRINYGSVIYSLRYLDDKKIFNFIKYCYLSFFHKKTVINNNRFKINVRLKALKFNL